MFAISMTIQLSLLSVFPIVTGFWLNRRLGLSWFLFMGGALAFVVSWMITILVPVQFNLLLSSVAQIGILYLVFRFLLTNVNSEREALMVGAGHGGIELILFGVFAVLSLLQIAQLRGGNNDALYDLAANADDIPVDQVESARVDELRESVDDFWNTPWYGPVVQPVQSFVQVLPLRNATDEKLASLIAEADAIPEESVQSSRIAELKKFIASFWDTPWYAPVVQPLQSLSYLFIQMALTVIVLGALTQNHWRPLIGAMALHLLSRILPLYGQLLGGIFAWLGISLLFGSIAVWFLKRLWPTVHAQTDAALAVARKAERRTQRKQ